MSAMWDAHINGDCWPSSCPVCQYEDETHEAECRNHGVRCDECDERMCSLDGPEPRACGTTCADCECSCTACWDARIDLRAELERQLEKDAD